MSKCTYVLSAPSQTDMLEAQPVGNGISIGEFKMTPEQIKRLIQFIESPEFQDGWHRITDEHFQKVEKALNDIKVTMEENRTGNPIPLLLSYDDVVFLWSCVHNCHNMQTASVAIAQNEDQA